MCKPEECSQPRSLPSSLLGCVLYGTLLSLIVLGCSHTEHSVETAEKSVKPPALVSVTAERIEKGEILFQYLDQKGNWQRASALTEIPAEQRSAVQVIDLSLSPEARRADRYIQLFDLRSLTIEGEYRGEVVDRRAFDATQAVREAAAAPPPIKMYSASWCGVCKKARRFLEQAGIPFQEIDVDKNRDAHSELQAKARRAGISASGVPVFDVGGQLIAGFDQRALMRAIDGGRGK